MSSTQFFIKTKEGSKVQGPYDIQQLKFLVADKRVKRKHFISTNEADWVEAESMPGLFHDDEAELFMPDSDSEPIAQEDVKETEEEKLGNHFSVEASSAASSGGELELFMPEDEEAKDLVIEEEGEFDESEEDKEVDVDDFEVRKKDEAEIEEQYGEEDEDYDEFNRSPRMKRFIGYLIDFMPPMIISAILLFFMYDKESSFKNAFLYVVVNFVTFASIHGVLLLTKKQTVGKMILKMKIIGENGEEATTQHIIQRYGIVLLVPLACAIVSEFLSFVFVVANACFIFAESKRCIHDLVGKTLVVEESYTPEEVQESEG